MKEASSSDVLDTCFGRDLPGLAFRVIDQEAVVINLRAGTFHILNPTAARLWLSMDGQTPLREIILSMEAETDVVLRNLTTDCVECVETLAAANLIRASRTAGA